VRYTGPNGVRYAHGTYRTKKDARRALAIVEASISNGTWRRKREIADGGLDGRSTLRQWSEEWIALRGRNGKPLATRTVDEYRRLIDSSLSLFADKPISSITSAQVEKWWAPYRVAAPRAANSSYKYMKALMDRAVKLGVLVENPCQIDGACSYRPLDDDDIPTDEQVSRLLEQAQQPWATFFLLVVSCGLRRGEVAELRRRDISFTGEGDDRRAEVRVTRNATWIANSEVRVGETKWSSTRSLVLGQEASINLEAYLVAEFHKSDSEALLFSLDPFGKFHLLESTIRNEVKKSFAQFGIKKGLHTLRRYSLTKWGQGGASLVEIMRRGGHKNVKAAMLYQRSTGRDSELADRVEANMRRSS
jgi:integrase